MSNSTVITQKHFFSVDPKGKTILNLASRQAEKHHQILDETVEYLAKAEPGTGVWAVCQVCNLSVDYLISYYFFCSVFEGVLHCPQFTICVTFGFLLIATQNKVQRFFPSSALRNIRFLKHSANDLKGKFLLLCLLLFVSFLGVFFKKKMMQP